MPVPDTVASFRTNLSDIFEDNNGRSRRLAMGQGYPGAGHAQLGRTPLGVPVEFDHGLTVGAHDDLDVLPTHRAGEIVAGERLVRRLFGRETRGVVARRLRVAARIIDLPEREQSLEGSLFVEGDHARNA